MKVKFDYLVMREIATGKNDYSTYRGCFDIEKNMILINCKLSTIQKIKTLIHELAHYFIYKLFSHTITEGELELGMKFDIMYYLNSLLDYEEKASTIKDMIEDWILSCRKFLTRKNKALHKT